MARLSKKSDSTMTDPWGNISLDVERVGRRVVWWYAGASMNSRCCSKVTEDQCILGKKASDSMWEGRLVLRCDAMLLERSGWLPD